MKIDWLIFFSSFSFIDFFSTDKKIFLIYERIKNKGQQKNKKK